MKKRLFYRTDDDTLAKTMTDEQFIEAARAQYQDEGSIEIDDGAKISRATDNGAYVQAWVWVEDAVPSDGSKPKWVKQVRGFTEKEVDRIEKMLGEVPAASVIENAIDLHEKTSTKTLKTLLASAEASFEAAGGRGIDQAEEIDRLKIALALRPLRKLKKKAK